MEKKQEMTLIAKPVIKNQYWIVTDGMQKVGNVVADGTGFSVRLNGNYTYFENTTAIKRQVNIDFQNTNIKSIKHTVSDFPTPEKTYNNILDLKRKIHIFTKTNKSKCYHAAGWYVLAHGEEPEVVFCPKYIFIQRYEYQGPFMTKDDAIAALNKR